MLMSNYYKKKKLILSIYDLISLNLYLNLLTPIDSFLFFVFFLAYDCSSWMLKLVVKVGGHKCVDRISCRSWTPKLIKHTWLYIGEIANDDYH